MLFRKPGAGAVDAKPLLRWVYITLPLSAGGPRNYNPGEELREKSSGRVHRGEIIRREAGC